MTWHSRAQQYEKSLWQTEWGNLTIVTLNDSTKDYRVEYDMSGFDRAEVLEVHQTLLSVSDRNYVSVPFDQISDDKFTLDIPAEAIATILAKIHSMP